MVLAGAGPALLERSTMQSTAALGTVLVTLAAD
jgi:hypothetical protein